jgi:hypothetical protein
MTAKRGLVVLVVAGAAVVAVCITFATLQFRAGVTAAVPQRVPGRFQIALSSGQWDVYQLTGITSGTSVGGVSFTVTRQQAATVDAAMMHVIAPDGRRLEVQNQSGNTVETLQLDSDQYTGVASFQAPESGRYSVTVDGGGEADVVIARPVLSVFRALLPWAGAALAGALCVLIGLLLLTFRHRRDMAAPPPAAPYPT